jgi:caffeoyl-CoA O-methyltransferase
LERLVAEHIENYVIQHTAGEDPLFAELAEETRKHTDAPQMMVGNIEGTFLRTLVRVTGAKRVLELGTFTGYSSLAMAMGLPDDGQLVTCDVSEEYTAIARRFWDRSPHGKKIKLVLGPATETIPTFEGAFDMAFIDADKENYLNYWDLVVPRMRRGGLIVADNVLWNGRVTYTPDTHDAETAALVAFSDKVKNDDRVEQVMLTVRDGMTLSTVL